MPTCRQNRGGWVAAWVAAVAGHGRASSPPLRTRLEIRRRGGLYGRPKAAAVCIRPPANRRRVRADMQSAPTSKSTPVTFGESPSASQRKRTRGARPTTTPPSWLCHATSPKALRALGEALACMFDDVAPTTRLGGRLIAAPTAEARGVSVRAACGGVSDRGWPGGGSVPSGKTDFQRRRGPKGPSPFLLGGRPRTAPGRRG